MKTTIPYLSFSGNCREAMEFYQQCLGGNLTIQAVGDYPEGKHLPNNMKAYVVQAILKKNDTTIMGSDLLDEEKLIVGNGVSILLECMSKEELMTYFDNLAPEGSLLQPIAKTDIGGYFGSLKDKYG